MSSRLADAREILRFMTARFREDSLAQVAGSLTFTTLFALVPMVTIVIAIFSALPISSRFVSTLNGFIVSNFVPGAATKLITAYTQQFAEKASHLTALGIGLLAVTALMLMLTIDHAFNRIWRVARPRSFLKRLLVHWALLTAGPLLIGASVYFASWLVSASLGLVDDRGMRGVLLKLVSFVLTFIALVLLYRLVPNRRVEYRDALAGATVAALAFEVLKAVFGLFVSNVGNYKLIYGTFAGFPVFLLWIYLSWMTVLAGAVLTATVPQLRTAAWMRSRVPGRSYVEALAILSELRRRHVEGEGVASLPALARAARLALDDAEGLLERMADRGWVIRNGGDDWLLARDARTIALSAVYDEFAYREAVLVREARRLGFSQRPVDAASALSGSLTLETWCDQPAVDGATAQPDAPR
ncbi:MAG: YihY family inner membrane protein [Burkholderiales bacterium]